MPLRTETYDLDDEVQRLEEKAAELDGVLNGADDNPAVRQLRGERAGIEAALEGARWARDEAFEADYAPQWDEDVDEITLGGLTAGEVASMEDGLGGGGGGAVRINQVAKATIDAPYIDDSMDGDERVATVAQLPNSYVKWAQARVDELTGVGGNEETNYRELYEEMQEASALD